MKMKTTTKLPPLVQMYDYSEVIEYYREHKGFIFSSTEIVRTETLKNHLELNIEADQLPDRVYFNGKPMKLIEELKQ